MKANFTIRKFVLLFVIFPFVLEGLVRAKAYIAGENYQYGFESTIRCYEPRKKTPALRIAALGGSTTYGISLPCNDTYPALMEKQLNSDYPFQLVEVINAGVPSLNTQGALERFREVILPLEPDVLVLNSVFNHFLPAAELDTTDGKVIVQRYVVKVVWNKNVLQGLNHFLLRRSLFYTKLREKIMLIRGYAAEKVWHDNVPFKKKVYNKRTISKQRLNQLRESLIASYEDVLEELIDLAQKHHVRVLLVKPPMDLVFSPDTNEWLPRHTNYFHQFLLHGHSSIDRLARRHHISVVDAYETFKSSRKKGLFLDPVHLTKAGNELLASEIIETLATIPFFNKQPTVPQ